MPNDVLNQVVLDRIARWVLGLADEQPALELHLFAAPWNFACDTVLANLTECTAPGYLPVALSAGGWNGGTAECISAFAYSAVPFVFTGPGVPGEIIYGHWIGDALSGDVLWGQSWTVPYTIPAAGGTIYLAPSWSDRQCPVPCCN